MARQQPPGNEQKSIKGDGGSDCVPADGEALRDRERLRLWFFPRDERRSSAPLSAWKQKGGGGVRRVWVPRSHECVGKGITELLALKVSSAIH